MEYIGLLLYGNFVLTAIVYLSVYRVRKLIGFQLGMNISMLSGGFLAIATGVILIYQFPLQFVTVTFVTTGLGMLVGSLFGGLFDYQTLLTGYANGLMMGIMSPMIGAAAKNSMAFLTLIELIFVASIILILSSTRYS